MSSMTQDRLVEMGRQGKGGEHAADAWADYVEYGPEDYSGEDAHYAAETAHYAGTCDPRTCEWYHTP